MDDKENLVGSLAHWVTAGKLDAHLVLPAISQIAGLSARPCSLLSLLEALEGAKDTALASLARHIREALRKEALRFHEKRKQGLPATDQERELLGGLSLDVADEWKLGGDVSGVVAAAITTTRDLGFLAAMRQKAPSLFREVKRQSDSTLATAFVAIIPHIERLATRLQGGTEKGGESEELAAKEVIDWLKLRLRREMEGWLKQLGGLFSRLPDAQRFKFLSVVQGESSSEAWMADLASAFLAASSRDEKALLLDCACAWMTPSGAQAIRAMSREEWARERIVFNLTLRFGLPALKTWEDWLGWLTNQERLWKAEEESLEQLIGLRGLLLILYSQLPDRDPAVLDALISSVYEGGPAIDAKELIRAWVKWAPMSEQRALLGLPEPLPPPLPPIIPKMEAAPPVVVPPAWPPVTAQTFAREDAGPLSPPRPSIWQNHIQPFFVENWYIVAGIAMVILGSSLLAYYTWDKHWLVRYTIMPTLLALFTWSLAGVGRWIEKKGDEFKSTAAILRGAAIGLLPINFMAMALLSADEKVPQKVPALLVMGTIYLSVFGWNLRNWCGAVEPRLKNLLAGTLLLLNALVAVGPLARTVGHLQGEQLLFCLGAGFYVGFLLTAGTIVRFSRRILTREMAEEKRVPWFVAAALAITFLQVFVWVHGFMRHLPHAHTYALLIILTGWLVLYAERRALELRGSPQIHGGESFLGFALVLLGLLMGFTDARMRIACFAVGGSVWMYQALLRKHPLHYWIALTLWALAGASVGMLPEYNREWLPLLGAAMAVAFGLGAWVLARQAKGPLSPTLSPSEGERENFSFGDLRQLTQACFGMQVVMLVLTTMVAPLTQWHYKSMPIVTAGWLFAVAVLLGWRALKDRKVHWLHATAAVMALVLPYAGFVDMAGRTAHHNTMVFGLALLSLIWLAITFAARKQRAEGKEEPLVLQSRSSVLWFYGCLAVAAMVLRVVLGDTAPDPHWLRDYMDYSGPILMMLVLIPATYYSRSLIPAGMAVVIMAILFPELKANLQASTPWLLWGTGLGSAIWGLVLILTSFGLREWRFLHGLPEGDRFAGRDLFPLRRYDHTLFTWPILAAALFLIIKVDTWTLIHHLTTTGVGMKTAVGIGLTGVAWTFLAIYHRESDGAIVAVHLGWLAIFGGICLGYWNESDDPQWSMPFLFTGLLLQGLYWFYRYALQPAREWARRLLTEQIRGVLLVGSAVLSVVCIGGLILGASLERMLWLYWFLLAQAVWHAVGRRHSIFGVICFFQIWIGLLAVTAPGSAPLWERVSVDQSVTPTLWLLIIIQIMFVALEFERWLRQRAEVTEKEGREDGRSETGQGARRLLIYGTVEPLLYPPFLIASGLAFLFGLAGIADGVHAIMLSPVQQALLLATLLLTARAHVSGVILLPALLLAYLMIHRNLLMSPGNVEQHIHLLITPWRLGLLGLGMVLLTQAARLAHHRNRTLLPGAFANPFFSARSCGWIFWPAAVICALAAFYHTFTPLREDAPQLWAPYLGALTFALIAWFWQRTAFFGGAGFLLTLGNIHLVRVFTGEFFRGHGLSEVHLVCLGLGLTLLQATLIRLAAKRTQSTEGEPVVAKNAAAIAAINLFSLGLACFILVLLSANYFTEPNVANISRTRFIVAGALACLAGQYFRRAARHPGPGEERYVDVCEALYHFGIVLALWCAALLVDWFRQPIFTLAAIALPIAYFYVRAESGARAGLPEARRYRNTATALGFIVLALYLFKGIFQLVLFPGTAISTEYYHYNAPLILLLGFVLLRLHGLGGTSWLAFYGGLALMTGTYFLLTALPGLSPFHNPIPSAWCALGLGHFWILASYARSPLRTMLQRLSKLDEAAWQSLRRSWGRCLLAATQGAVVFGLTDYESDTFMVAPLLAGAATVFIHEGVILLRTLPANSISAAQSSRGFNRGVFYLVMAALEITAALHADFLVTSYLSRENVIWAILLIWLAVLVIYQIWRFSPDIVGNIALALAALLVAHVAYHRPWTDAGLWGVALGTVLAAWNPQRNRQPSNAVEAFCGGVLLWIPAWLVYFRNAPFDDHGLDAGLESWPILATTLALFLTGVVARLFPIYLAPNYDRWPRSQSRLFDSTFAWLKSSGSRIHYASLWLTLVIAALIQVAHYQTAFAPREIAVLTVLEAALAVAWFYEGRDRQSMVAYYLMQIAALACFASIRRQLMLTTTFWNNEYDVWASLAFSLALAGAKQIFELQPRALRVPLLTSMLILPAVALVWVLVHHLGVNIALLVVGLHSVMFAYLGKDKRESPYNILALSGFVAFILITFYSKLHLRAIHAYVIPVGLGVLVLQELFRARIKPEARNWIRLVTLMAMLGSAGYYALADSRHAITFNLTMILLCLLAMGLGSFLRIIMYLAVGFGGLMVDLASILYKVLVHMERSARMTVVGSLVLLIGAVLVFGAIYYKTNKAKLDAWGEKWRLRLTSWD